MKIIVFLSVFTIATAFAQDPACEYCIYPTATVTATVSEKVFFCIAANNTISAGANALYQAGTEVLLTDGFVAQSGSVSHFYIQDCSLDIIGRPFATDSRKQSEKTIAVYQDNYSDYLMISPADFKLIQFNIYSLDGKLLSRGSVIDSRIDISPLATGIYLVSLGFDDGSVLLKDIVKQ